jgi:hypothetical protein
MICREYEPGAPKRPASGAFMQRPDLLVTRELKITAQSSLILGNATFQQIC